MDERLKLSREIDLDSDQLFGKIEDIIKNLQRIKGEHPDKDLEIMEKWSGYEDNYFVLQYWSEETDDEYNYRLQSERDQSEELRELEEVKRNNQRVQAEINRLKNQLK